MNDSQKILYEFNRQRRRVLEMIAALATSRAPSVDDAVLRGATAQQPRSHASR